MAWLARRDGLLLLACLLVGCIHRTGKVAPNHQLPTEISIYVVMSAEVAAQNNDGGAIAAMVEALDDELRERGFHPTIVVARHDEKPPLPRIEVQVLSADWGNRGMRGAGNLAAMAVPPATVVAIAGGGSMLVDCYVVQADSQVTYSGRFKAGTFGSDGAGYDTVHAEHAGRSIAVSVADP